MNARLLPLALLVASCAPAPASFTDGERGAVVEEVRAASFALQDALNAHDPDAILSHYALDADFVYVGCTNYMFGGDLFGTIVAGYHRQHPEATWDLSVQSLRALGPGAAVVSLQGRGGPLSDLFVTRVLEKDEGGRWLVVHEHESWPGCSAPAAPHPGTAPGDTAAITPEGGAF
ncbi:MAG: hypothetical protein AMXMBFR53_16290 [Gemmatimonadota bacterium]